MTALSTISAMPYVPGEARGVLSRDPLRPGAIVLLDLPAQPAAARPAGVVVAEGAPFSPPMLALLAHGLPTVIVTAEQARALCPGELVQIDGARGTVRRADAEEPFHPVTPTLPPCGRPVFTADGMAVSLRSSVRDAVGAACARERGAEAIGLVRTEYIQPHDGRQPDTVFYAREFDNLLAAAQPLKVTLRLLDIAVDEQPAWLPAGKAFGGALGRQGVRLFEDEPVRSVVDAQLAALAGCDAYGRLRLLIPYITNVAEAAHWHARIRARLDVSVGMMIETPAANAVCIPYPAVTVQAIQVVADRALAQSVCRAKSSLDVREMLGVD